MSVSENIAITGKSSSSGVVDSRKAANFYVISNSRAPVFIWSGDSTTEQMHGAGLVKYDGTWSAKALAGNIRPDALMYNYGANGTKLEGAIAGTLGNNAGGLNPNIGYIASLKGDVYILGWGVNSARSSASVAASTMTTASSAPDSNMLSFVDSFRSSLITAANMILASNPSAIIVFRAPNAHVTGSTYLNGGVD